MTPERKKWWDSLSEREKMLRKKIYEVKHEISWAKHRLQFDCFAPKAIKFIIAGIKTKKVTLTALKHELDRTTAMIYTGHYEGVSPIYRCEKCGNEIKDIGQWYCPYCGREIKGWRY